MKSKGKAIFFGFIVWLVPFLTAFLFIDRSGEFVIPETFFKTIMIVVGSFVGITLAVKYFKDVKRDYIKEGIKLGLMWLVINWTIDLLFVQMKFFDMSVYTYFTDIGLRLLGIPMYTIGLGYALKNTHKK